MRWTWPSAKTFIGMVLAGIGIMIVASSVWQGFLAAFFVLMGLQYVKEG